MSTSLYGIQMIHVIPQTRKQFDIPLAVGFGLSLPHHYQGVSKLAEAAVVGSSIIKAIESGSNTQERCDKVKEFCHTFLGTAPK
jgi:tryptophan synthase alpha subunit